MNVTLKLNSEVERSLMARASERGLSLDEYLLELVAKEVGVPTGGGGTPKQFDNLSDLLLNSPFAGANLDIERPPDYPRSVDLG